MKQSYINCCILNYGRFFKFYTLYVVYFGKIWVDLGKIWVDLGRFG